MDNNKFHALCSNEILKIISSLIDNDSNLSLLSDNYNSLFEKSNKVNIIWPLISTSLLMSENLYKYDKAYNLISSDTMKLILDKLYMYPIIQFDKTTVSPCLLDDKNNAVNCFLNYIKLDFDQGDYYNNCSCEEQFLKEALQFGLMIDDLKDTSESLRNDSSYGCNESIIEDGFINVRKFIERTRNALAHSNYEVIDENHIRLYHYNANTKKLDFNVILEPSLIVLIVDELNEIASDKYSYFMDYYYDPSFSTLLETEIIDETIIQYMLSFDMFDEEIASSILNEIKNKKEYLNVTTDKEKVIIINETIYERIKPAYDVGIIINDYLYCDETGKIISDELYDKYGVFNYLNSEYYNTSEGNINDDVYVQNKFKFLLLALLNCSLLNGYNINEGKNIGIIDFSKMNIDKDTLKQFCKNNHLKTLNEINIMKQEIDKNEKQLEKKAIAINKKRDILMKHNIDNDYFNNVLPSQIQKLESERMNITASNICTLFELEKAKLQGCSYNFRKNISQFIFNHLRNSLAHGYVTFQKNIDLSNVSDAIITFEDYNPDNKKELTFRGSIKVGSLLTVITSNEYANYILGMNTSKIDSKINKYKCKKLQ